MKSLKNPAIPRTNIACTGSKIRVNTKIDADAPRKPVIAMIRRALTTLPSDSASFGPSQPAMRQPTPPSSNGDPVSSASTIGLNCSDVCRASRKYVGSHVT